jgi:hypothetical protein
MSRSPRCFAAGRTEGGVPAGRLARYPARRSLLKVTFLGTSSGVPTRQRNDPDGVDLYDRDGQFGFHEESMTRTGWSPSTRSVFPETEAAEDLLEVEVASADRTAFRSEESR